MLFCRFRKSWLAGWAALLALIMALVVGCGSAATPKAAQGTAPAPAATPQPKVADLILATTTSTQDSGLLDVLKPLFESKTGYKLKIVAVGTGQALAMGERGEADVLLVHAPDAEKQSMAKSGAEMNRQLVMHNDFILVGPAVDPAKIKGVKSTAEAFKKILDAKATFVSRGDNSGTDIKEKSIWKAGSLKPEGSWYLSAGAGMGQTLTIASEKGGYTLTDRATFLAQKKNLQLEIVLEGEPELLNIYHVMQVNPQKYPKVNADGAKAFADYLLSKDGQDAIGKFGVDKFGAPLFFPDGGKTDEQMGLK